MADGDREGEQRIFIQRLPKPGARLLGRAADGAWLDACWAEHARVAVVAAPGGTGKSALVWDWLQRMQADGWRGAERVYGWSFRGQGAHRLACSDEFVDTALRWLGDAEPSVGSPWEKGERLAALLTQQRTVLVLDGVEPLQSGQGRIKDPALQVLVKALAAQGTGLVILTSRVRVTDPEALAGAEVRARDLERLSAEAGAELLEARGAKGSKDDLQAAANEYEGNALALTWLGSYVKRAHKGDIAKRDLPPPLPGQPAQRVIAAFEKHFARKPEIAVLRTLGIFDRPAREDETAVLRANPKIRGLTAFLDGPPRPPPHAWEKAVATLRDIGFVAPALDGAAGDVLDTHPVVREYFAALLRREHPETWRDGHRRLYEHLKKTAKERPTTVEESTPTYAAVTHACLAAEIEGAMDLYWKCMNQLQERHNWQALGAYASEISVLSAFFDPPWEKLAPGAAWNVPAWVSYQIPPLLGAIGRLDEGVQLLRISVGRAVGAKDARNAAQIAMGLADLLLARGDLRDAEDAARRSFEIAEKNDESVARRMAKPTLGAVLHARGLRGEATAQFEEAERPSPRNDMTPLPLSSVWGFLYRELMLDQGRDADVRRRGASFFAKPQQNETLLDVALEHLSFGLAHVVGAQRGAAVDLAEAASHIDASVGKLRRAGRFDHLPRALLARAALHTHNGAFALARKDLDDALTLATRCGLRLHACDAHLGLARLAVAEGALAAVQPHVERARKIVDETGYHRRDEELAALEAAGRAA